MTARRKLTGVGMPAGSLVWAGITVIFLAGGLAGLAGCLAAKTAYLYQGTLAGKPVNKPVVIVRDGEGVPHIYADDAGDLFFGLGYVMAQDRLFQMDLYRHAAQGRLAEWFGNARLEKGMRLVQLDMLLKCLEIEANTGRAIDRLDPENRHLLERFAAGINQLIDDQARKPAIEYRLLRLQPEAWTAADVMTVPEIFGAGLALITVGTEVLYESLKHAAGAELAEDFMRRYAGGDLAVAVPAAISDGNAVGAKAPGAAVASNLRYAESLEAFAGSERQAVGEGGRSGRSTHWVSAFSPGGPPRGEVPSGSAALLFGNLLTAGSILNQGLPQGSNNWVVAGSRTQSGKPLLANDPHVPLGPAPSFWYHAHLEGGGYSTAGLLYTGYPAVIVGWNEQVAWGVTNVMADQVDLFRERLDPALPDRYLTPDGWRDFDQKQVLCKVRCGRDRGFTLRKGIHGALLPAEALKNAYTRKYPWMLEPASLRYVDTDPAAFFEGEILLMKAGNSGEVKQALGKIALGPTAFNYVFATQEGDIGYHAGGVIPIRPDGQGYRPREGWTREGEWQGVIPFDRLPAVDNPAEGFFETANQRVAPPNYPWYITGDYARPFRSMRIRQLLLEAKSSTAEDLQKIQADVHCLPADRVLDILREAFGGQGADNSLSPAEAEALRVLAGWNRVTSCDSAGAALFEVFYQCLLESTFSDEAGKDLSGPLLSTDFVPAKVMDTLLDDPDNIWFDNTSTPAREGRDAIFADSFREAVRRCGKLMGKEPASWSWGEIHSLRLTHPFGLMPLFGKKYRIATLPYPGDNDTVNGGYFFLAKHRGKVFAGAASRFVVDFAQPGGAWFNCSTGVAGEPSSAYFKNLTDGWYRHAYFRTERTPRPEEVAGGRKLVLAP